MNPRSVLVPCSRPKPRDRPARKGPIAGAFVHVRSASVRRKRRAAFFLSPQAASEPIVLPLLSSPRSRCLPPRKAFLVPVRRRRGGVPPNTPNKMGGRRGRPVVHMLGGQTVSAAAGRPAPCPPARVHPRPAPQRSRFAQKDIRSHRAFGPRVRINFAARHRWRASCEVAPHPPLVGLHSGEDRTPARTGRHDVITTGPQTPPERRRNRFPPPGPHGRGRTLGRPPACRDEPFATTHRPGTHRERHHRPRRTRPGTRTTTPIRLTFSFPS